MLFETGTVHCVACSPVKKSKVQVVCSTFKGKFRQESCIEKCVIYFFVHFRSFVYNENLSKELINLVFM
jgi:hypothetical protein